MSRQLQGTTDVSAVEAPVTLKAYLLCAFASFGGIFFGYDSGYINGVLASQVFIDAIMGPGHTEISSSRTSLIVSILSAGTFFGALIAGDLADKFGRRPTIIAGCTIYVVGVVLQMFAATALATIVIGRLVAGFGVGFVSAIIILYMSEICPRKVRGSLVSGYQFAITIGIMLASIVCNYTQERSDASSYRIPIGIQFAWGTILAVGLFFLPDSPRYWVKKGQLDRARDTLVRLRGQPPTSQFIEVELAEIVANAEIESKAIPTTSWFGSWAACFTGSLWNGGSNLRRTILGTSLQMMQQWTGVNFIFYYSSTFLKSTGAVSNVFLLSMAFTIVNVCSTPISFWTVERFGRRPLLIVGAFGMVICQFIIAIVGVTIGFDKSHLDAAGETVANNVPAVNAQVAFIAISIFFFATTWGPCAWVLIGEIFPLPIRSRGVALSTASNWLWNTILAVITPYLVGTGSNSAHMKSSVFFLWGSLCACAFVYSYFLVPETKGLTLEQVDQMLQETTPRTSARWRPTHTFAQETGKVGGEVRHFDDIEDHEQKKAFDQV